MLNIEDFLRTSRIHDETIATRPYEEMWSDYLNTDINTLIYAPRQSGKSYALINKLMVSTDDTMYITMNEEISRNTSRVIQSQFNFNAVNNIISISNRNIENEFRGRDFKNIILDEIDFMESTNLLTFLMSIYSRVRINNGKIIAITSKKDDRIKPYESFFDRIINLPYDYIRRQNEMFNRNNLEEELFEI